MEEYLRVLAYPKFRLAPETVSLLLESEILPFGEAIDAPAPDPRKPLVAADPADDHFLLCAAKGRADRIVSGDQHLLALGEHRSIPIVGVQEFLREMNLG